MISTQSADGQTPASLRASCTPGTKPGSTITGAGTFTDTDSRAPAACQRAQSVSALVRICLVMVGIRPAAWMSGRKVSGVRIPSTGCRQRTSVSIPVTRPVRRSALGW